MPTELACIKHLPSLAWAPVSLVVAEKPSGLGRGAGWRGGEAHRPGFGQGAGLRTAGGRGLGFGAGNKPASGRPRPWGGKDRGKTGVQAFKIILIRFINALGASLLKDFRKADILDDRR